MTERRFGLDVGHIILQVQIQTLRDAADDLEGKLGVEGTPGTLWEYRRWLRERADRLEQGENKPPEPAPWVHPNHKPTQHRDGNPPWCDECGWSSPKPMQPAVFYRKASDA